MKKYFFIFFIAANLFALFQDEELEQMWSMIEDINHPTLEEYQLIENYLSAGKRTYLDDLRKSDQIKTHHERLNLILKFKLLGPNQTMPFYKKFDFNITELTERRCIVLFSSANGIYPTKLKKLLKEIEDCGFSGHVLVRIGGFPNTEFGGMKICHVPYSFKVAFLQEAKRLGFKEILWIDLAIHPLNDFETVFSEIQSKGYFFTNVGTLWDNSPTHLPNAAKVLNINPDQYSQIPHISSSMIGLNMENMQAIELLETWYRETEKVYPYITWWPEELSLSVIAWRLGCKPFIRFGNWVCGESEQFQLENRPTIQFYIDALR